jgi:hypothetical protein
MAQFFETKMGQQFYDGTMPRIAKALEAIAKQLELKGVLEHLEAHRRELLDLLEDHDTAWDNEEDSVKEEHAELIARTRAFLAKEN